MKKPTRVARFDPWITWDLPGVVTEHRFDAKRRFRFDYAWPSYRIAVEQQGAVWTGGAHGRGTGITRDYTKLNLAQEQGWVVGQFTPTEVKSGKAAAWVLRVMERRDVHLWRDHYRRSHD